MTADARPTDVPSSTPILRRVLAYGALLALVIAIVAGVIGGLVAGFPGVVSGLVGPAMALVFLGITAASILFANRFTGREFFVVAFFAIVLGSFLVKFVVFLVLAIVLRDQPWVVPTVLFLSLIAGIIGSLVVDVLVVLRSRMPYISDPRPRS